MAVEFYRGTEVEMNDPIRFFIPCIPPTATAQQKGVMVVGGKPRFFKKKRQQQAENTFHALLLPHRPPQPFDCAVSLCVVFSFPWRASEKKSRIAQWSSYPISVRPDVDNLGKALIDVMTTLRFWRDDSQIARMMLEKQYSDEPGILVVLCEQTGERRL